MAKMIDFQIYIYFVGFANLFAKYYELSQIVIKLGIVV